LFSRYEPTEPINVSVLEGIPTIVNFTLNGEISHEQGKTDIDYPQIIPLFHRFPASLYKMILDYDDPNY